MNTIKVKKLHPQAIVPRYAHLRDAGMDLYSNEEIILQPGDRALVPTGISMAIPTGNVGLIWDRSGLAAKNGLTTLGGVIDQSYRGEIKVVIYNSSNVAFIIEKGMRIAQMLIQPVEQKEIREVESLDDTSRGAGGFGSTGLR